jgi:hypothetical protein
MYWTIDRQDDLYCWDPNTCVMVSIRRGGLLVCGGDTSSLSEKLIYFGDWQLWLAEDYVGNI